MTKACSWHLKYETSAGVNEAQGSCRAALLSRTGNWGLTKAASTAAGGGTGVRERESLTHFKQGQKSVHLEVRREFLATMLNRHGQEQSLETGVPRLCWDSQVRQQQPEGSEVTGSSEDTGEAVLKQKDAHSQDAQVMAIIQFMQAGSCQLRGDAGK